MGANQGEFLRKTSKSCVFSEAACRVEPSLLLMEAVHSCGEFRGVWVIPVQAARRSHETGSRQGPPQERTRVNQERALDQFQRTFHPVLAQ